MASNAISDFTGTSAHLIRVRELDMPANAVYECQVVGGLPWVGTGGMFSREQLLSAAAGGRLTCSRLRRRLLCSSPVASTSQRCSTGRAPCSTSLHRPARAASHPGEGSGQKRSMTSERLKQMLWQPPKKGIWMGYALHHDH